jgi:lysophospholipase L1-like esterase
VTATLFWGALVATTFATRRGMQQSSPFARDIAQFQAQDRKNPPAPNQILFVGSSSFTRWTDLSSYFPGYPILNRAFGGSTFLDQIRYVDDVVFPYQPKQIVLYCGENDFATDSSLAPQIVADRFVTLFRMIRKRLPRVEIAYVSMKPSPSRWSMREKFLAANRWIEQYLKHQRHTAYVNVWDAMLDQNGQPKADIFVADRLHMNASGYKIWQPLIQGKLVR